MSSKPHAEYILIQTLPSGKVELASANSLAEIGEKANEMAGRRVATDGGEK